MQVADVSVTVVGIGVEGWAGLADAARAEVLGADVVLGSVRQLALLPDDDDPKRRQVWPSPLVAALPEFLKQFSDQRIVALASGDPLLSGIGSTLIKLIGAERVTIVPHVSSEMLARARLGWPAESATTISVVGRSAYALLRELAPGRRVIVLSSDENTPAELTQLLTARGFGASRIVVFGDLGGTTETVVDTTVADYSGTAPRLNLVALELAGPLFAGWVAGLPDHLFEHDGQLTKRDLRASALSRLLPVPGQQLWDVGAGAGSIGIEWMRSHPTCQAIAVEADSDRAGRIARNANALGVPKLTIVQGSAPEALLGLPDPDAIFIGGGATRPGVLPTCLGALAPGGRIVVHGVTVETEVLLADTYAEHGGELTRIHVEHAGPVGSFTGWTPARSVTQWSFTKDT